MAVTPFFSLTLGQARTLVELYTEIEAIFEPQPGVEPPRSLLEIEGFTVGGELHVLVMPGGEWFVLAADGTIRSRRIGTRQEVLTTALRTSHWWEGMRALLASRGLDPQRIVVGDVLDDDWGLESGLLVTEQRRVIEYTRRYDPDADGDPGTIEAWDDITESWQADRAWLDTAASALALFTAQEEGSWPPAPGTGS